MGEVRLIFPEAEGIAPLYQITGDLPKKLSIDVETQRTR